MYLQHAADLTRHQIAVVTIFVHFHDHDTRHDINNININACTIFIRIWHTTIFVLDLALQVNCVTFNFQQVRDSSLIN